MQKDEVLKIMADGITLKDAANTIGGQILTRVAGKNGSGKSVRVLTPKAIVAGVIVKEYLGESMLAREVDGRKYTREGDVVIKLSTPYDAAYVTAGEEGLLIPSFCAAVRVVKEDVLDAKYLSAFLNSSYARCMLGLIRNLGSPMIRLGDISNLRIPKVPVRDMKDIGEAYMLSGRKKAVLREMIRTEECLMESIVLANIREVADNG